MKLRLHWVTEHLDDRNIPEMKLLRPRSFDLPPQRKMIRPASTINSAGKKDCTYCNKAEYLESIATLPLPAPEQTLRYASYLADLIDFTRSLTLYPKVPLYLYLDPAAGMKRVKKGNGDIEIVEVDAGMAKKVSCLNTAQYLRLLGHWTFFSSATNKISTPLQTADGVKVPPELVREGTAEVSSLIMPLVNYDSWPTCRDNLDLFDLQHERAIIEAYRKLTLDTEFPDNFLYVVTTAQFCLQDHDNRELLYDISLIREACGENITMTSAPWKNETIFRQAMTEAANFPTRLTAFQKMEIIRSVQTHRAVLQGDLNNSTDSATQQEMNRYIDLIVCERIRQLNEMTAAMNRFMDGCTV